ncbi:hypothetical protein KTO58_16680 [Chitinophaga pendula]|uniref:DUF5683 domain-containing protein n=1 Tax=Chitinophaga TaxID=79328 RepID=UPI0012FE25E3|nr:MULTISPECIES: DUF5683 domain-containing protein [Chitinophaga]UCJ05326.1 hypothetical protein KTO58_16680 [Chitinophaga pendula]
MANLIKFLRNTGGLLMTLLFLYAPSYAQDTTRPAAKAERSGKDTLRMPSKAATDSTLVINTKQNQDTALDMRLPTPHSPRKAAFYSAVLPGLGQYYNKQYWKIPLVYAALGTTTGFFIYNFQQYKEFRDAYRIRIAGNVNVKDKYIDLYRTSTLKTLRDTYRQYVDYSVLFFIVGYGLNIIDATVFAHLKAFDMSNDLSFRITPKMIDSRTLGLSLQINVGKRKNKQVQTFALGR